MPNFRAVKQRVLGMAVEVGELHDWGYIQVQM